ncbi:MAG: DNA polymerase III subunit epsilon [Bacteroidetes bacterium]|nr:MAG: DNA polymerase III subunit epsilon [Bacteroidota bacterium]
MYAIVDIETTGGYAAAHGITEISIHVFDGNNVVEKFETLVNPGQPIPRYIQAMTGITDEMVAKAPSFEDVAESVYNFLNDRVFVAHNVNFDYSFLKAHLAAVGYEYNAKRLCTVRLSRKIFPGFPSYGLGKLCNSLDIPIENRHRAGGDAAATVQVFRRLVQNDSQQYIQKSLQRSSKEQMLPPNVPKEHFERLPYTPGVYYFHNEKGKIIYVGKAKNIRYRINSHFSSNLDSRQKQNFIRYTHAISFQNCGTELMACILESSEIKRLWPIFNYSQKRWEDVYGVFAYEDQNGYLRLAIEKNKKHIAPVYSFHYLVDGHSILRKLISQFNLCPRLCFMRADNEPCDSSCAGACERKENPLEYNRRVEQAIQSLNELPSYAIVDKGLNGNDQSCILVLKGKLYGMGYIPADAQITNTDGLKDYLQPYRENSFIRNLLNGYSSRYPSKIIRLIDPSPSQATESFHSQALC